ncbi:MAG TPA: 4-hydroxyphenylpyruvate dioxygenase [Actinobacteria bacterium]|nr:4-hydroxyphenylpyruvate dioxygenase [Actinomycetota bacterium]
MNDDAMPIEGYDYIEFYVGNAVQAAHFYASAFGFDLFAYKGPETGVRDSMSFAMQQDRLRFVFTGSLVSDNTISRHHLAHGDGVRDVAFRVPDAASAFRMAVDRGATAHREPETIIDNHGEITLAAIEIYGDTIHTFVERAGYGGGDAYGDCFLPGYEPRTWGSPKASTGLKYVDHVVCNVELGEMDAWARFYAEVMGFTQLAHFNDDQISTDFTALMSKVLWDGEGRIKLPINEPAEGKKKSQIEEYLDFYNGPGVQHLALATNDILATVSALRAAGIEFLTVPATYYEDLKTRLDWTRIGRDIGALADLGILVDQDDEGYLLQIFTKPVQDRPTLFYEIIERHGSRGFGVGNFKALFESIEREQGRRGNL